MMFKFIRSQHWPLSSCAVWLFCPLRAAMADGVRKTVAFLATYVEELVRLQKPTLAAVLKSNRANQVKEWKAAQNFWERKRQTLTVEQQNLFEDWEFVLCNMSTLETVAFLYRKQTFFAFNRTVCLVWPRCQFCSTWPCRYQCRRSKAGLMVFFLTHPWSVGFLHRFCLRNLEP